MKITGCCLPYGESKYHDAVQVGAFAHQDGAQVPLVQDFFDKNNPENVIGHCRSKSLYFKDEAWMKYHKCPLCGNYVLKEPERIKVPRSSAGTHKINMWNEALWVICWDKKATPCIKCVSDLTRYFMLDPPITATRTGLVVGGDSQ